MRTGNKFKCLGLGETTTLGWNENFTIKKVYHEVDEDNNGDDLCNKRMLLLESDNTAVLYVDEDQFALTNESPNPRRKN